VFLLDSLGSAKPSKSRPVSPSYCSDFMWSTWFIIKWHQNSFLKWVPGHVELSGNSAAYTSVKLLSCQCLT